MLAEIQNRLHMYIYVNQTFRFKWFWSNDSNQIDSDSNHLNHLVCLFHWNACWTQTPKILVSTGRHFLPFLPFQLVSFLSLACPENISQVWQERRKEGFSIYTLLNVGASKICKKLWNPCSCVWLPDLARCVSDNIRWSPPISSSATEPSPNCSGRAANPQFLPKGSPYSTTLCSNGSVYNLVPRESWNRDPLLDFSGRQLFGTLRYVLC